jgi:hypothetical protein
VLASNGVAANVADPGNEPLAELGVAPAADPVPSPTPDPTR